jgi:hypothetical protein
MINTRYWIGIVALLLSFPVFAADIEISDAWIRPTTQGYENGMVGLTLTAPVKIKIIGVNSPAYTTTEIQKPSKRKGEKKMETIKSVSLSVGKSIVFGPDSIHLALSGNKNTLNAGEKVPVILTVQYENKTTKDITFLAQPVRIRAGAAPLPIASSKGQTMPLPVEQPDIQKHAQMPAPVVDEPIPAKVEASAEPIIEAPNQMQKAVPAASELPSPIIKESAEPIIAEPVLQSTPDQLTPNVKLTEQTNGDDIKSVEDCIKYSKAMNACNQAGELDDIIKCRNIAKSKFTCS